MIEEALNYYQEGNYAAAEPLFRRMLEDEPKNPEVLYMLSLALQKQSRAQEATEFLEQAIEVQPANPALHIALGTSEVQAGNMGRAEQAFRKAVEIDANLVQAQNGLAFVELADGRVTDAEQTLKLALKADPGNIQSLVNMGIALFQQDRLNEAVNHLKQALEADPANAVAHAYLGRAFAGQGNAGFAIQCYENALSHKPDSPELLHLLAGVQLETGHVREAVENYRKLLAIEEENPVTLAGLARAQLKLGNPKHAEQMFLRTLHLDPGNTDVLFEFCAMLLNQGRNSEVLVRLEQAGAMADDSDRTRFLMARARLAMGDAAMALDLMGPLVSQGGLEPEMRLLLVRILMETGEADSANAQLDRLLKEDRPLADAVIFRARQQLEHGFGEDAKELLTSIQNRHDLNRGQRRLVTTLLGRILHHSGLYHAAYEQFLALDHPRPAVLSIQDEKKPLRKEDEAAETAIMRDVAWSWPARGPDDGLSDPVFVFGWPGSGRLPVLKALGVLPGVTVIQDEFSNQRERRWLVSTPRGAGPLGDLDEARIRLARRRYWKMARAAEAGAVDGIIVDAMWLAAESLPTIYRLFPTSRIVVFRHEPRDMVLSWLQAGFDDLENMAVAYQKQLELLKRCERSIPLVYAGVDARDLIADPQGALEDLVKALSMDWDSAVIGAYTSAVRDNPLVSQAWEHYREWLKPAIAVFDSTD